MSAWRLEPPPLASTAMRARLTPAGRAAGAPPREASRRWALGPRLPPRGPRQELDVVRVRGVDAIDDDGAVAVEQRGLSRARLRHVRRSRLRRGETRRHRERRGGRA